jgi:hypothetical protein
VKDCFKPTQRRRIAEYPLPQQNSVDAAGPRINTGKRGRNGRNGRAGRREQSMNHHIGVEEGQSQAPQR